MQAVIALPNHDNRLSASDGAFLLQPVCGIPLIARVIGTAERAGADEVLLVGSLRDPVEIKNVCSQRLESSSNIIDIVPDDSFDPSSTVSWKGLSGRLQNEFLWIPWNWITSARVLADLPQLQGKPLSWSVPWRLLRSEVPREDSGSLPFPSESDGVAVTSQESLIEAERWLVRHSGKRLDGIHSKFNRWLCRPAVRALARTRTTPNMVTLAGLLLAMLSAFFFAQGTYLDAVAGAILFFLAGLADEIDGMLARLKFADSTFGCWFEGFVDNASYILLFLSVTLGLSAQGSRRSLLVGGLALIGCSVSIALIALQRSKATRPDCPNEYLGKVYGLLESDSGSSISRITRQIHFITKKG